MYAYPQVNTTVELLQYQNEVLVGGMLGLGILIFIFVVLIIRLSVINSKSGIPFAVASFVTTIVAILFKGMNLINDSTLIGCIVLSVISIIFLLVHSD